MKKIISISFILLVGIFSTIKAQYKIARSIPVSEYNNRVEFNKSILEDQALMIEYHFDFVKIVWQTNAEVNSSYFELQRAAMDEEFVTIKKIKAGNITSVKTSYKVTFGKIKIGQQKINYRLKMVFKDGSSTVSDITAFEMLAPSGLRGYVSIPG